MTSQVANRNSVLAGHLALNCEGTIVPIDQPRITVGAGPRCTVRLQNTNAQSLHCLITSGPEGWRVRRWSDATRLNGAEFDEAPLKAGDRLELAGTVIEVESLPGSPAESRDAMTNEPQHQTVCTPKENSRKHYSDRCRTLLSALRESQRRERRLQESLAEAETVARTNNFIESQELSSLGEGGEGTAVEVEPMADEVEPLAKIEESVDSTDQIVAQTSEPDEFHHTKDARDLRWLSDEGVERQEPSTEQALQELATDEVEEGNGLPDEATEFASASPIIHTMMLPEDHIASDSEPTPETVDSQSEHDTTSANSERDPSWNWDIESASGSQDAASLWGAEVAEASKSDVKADALTLSGSDEHTKDEEPELQSDWQSWADDEAEKQPVIANLQSEPPIATADEPDLLQHEFENEGGSVEEQAKSESSSVLGQGLFSDSAGEALPPESPRNDTDEAVTEQQSTTVEASDAPEEAQTVETRIDSLFAPQSEPSKESGSSEKESGSFIERYAHLLDDGDEDEPVPPAQGSNPELTSEPIEVAPTAQDDDSIENYMEKMMERLRGKSEPTSSEHPGASVPSPIVESAQAARAEKRSVDPPHEPVVSPIRSLDELQRSQTPESADDLNAFRELANESARHAIGVAKIRRARDVAATSLVICSISFGVGFYMMISSSNILAIEIVTGSLLMLVSAWWGSRQANAFLSTTREVKQLAKRAKES